MTDLRDIPDVTLLISSEAVDLLETEGFTVSVDYIFDENYDDEGTWNDIPNEVWPFLCEWD